MKYILLCRGSIACWGYDTMAMAVGNGGFVEGLRCCRAAVQRRLSDLQRSKTISTAAMLLFNRCRATLNATQLHFNAAMLLSTVALRLTELLAGFVVGIETADVEAAGGHGPSVHLGLLDHVVGQVAGGIRATAVLDAVAHEVDVLLQVDVERWNGPVALGLLGLLFHIENLVLFVHDDDTGALELLNRGLLVAHDAAGSLLLGKIHELLEGEEEEVVGSDN